MIDTEIINLENKLSKSESLTSEEINKLWEHRLKKKENEKQK
jgi:hypothetical protein